MTKIIPQDICNDCGEPTLCSKQVREAIEKHEIREELDSEDADDDGKVPMGLICKSDLLKELGLDGEQK